MSDITLDLTINQTLNLRSACLASAQYYAKLAEECEPGDTRNYWQKRAKESSDGAKLLKRCLCLRNQKWDVRNSTEAHITEAHNAGAFDYTLPVERNQSALMREKIQPGSPHLKRPEPEPDESDADLVEAAEGEFCTACGCESIDCSRNPCPAVLADRQEGETDEARDMDRRREAREQYALKSSDDIEIDEDAVVSYGEGGAWVAAWVWVAD